MKNSIYDSSEYLLAKKIIDQRLKKKMSQRALAKKLNTSQAAISRIETMQANPSFSFLKRIAQALDSQLNIAFTTMTTKQKLDIIRQKHNLTLILMHGSHVTGKTHPKSDLDIAVLANNHQENINPLKLITDLSNALQVDNLDLTNLTHADPLLLQTVTSKCRLLSGSQYDLDKLQLKSFHRYNDYLPYLKLEHQFVQSNL